MHNCDNCKHETTEEKKAPETIPFIVWEATQDRYERNIKRWMVAFFVALAMLFVTNIGWIIYESQFETYYYAQDGADVNNVNIGEQGSIYNGSGIADQEEETNGSEGEEG